MVADIFAQPVDVVWTFYVRSIYVLCTGMVNFFDIKLECLLNEMAKRRALSNSKTSKLDNSFEFFVNVSGLLFYWQHQTETIDWKISGCF